MKTLTLIILMTIWGGKTALSQEIIPRYSYNIELGLPVAMGNKPFDDIMQGLVSVSTYGQYSFPFHMHLGVGIKYQYLTINEFSVPSPRFGGVHTGAVFGKIGWDKFHTDRFATDIGMKIGYTQNYFATSPEKGKGLSTLQVNAAFVEPTLSLILLANEKNSYRWIIGYGIQGFGFRPQHIGLQSDEGYDPAEFSKPTQYLVVGFGYTYYFRPEKAN